MRDSLKDIQKQDAYNIQKLTNKIKQVNGAHRTIIVIVLTSG